MAKQLCKVFPWLCPKKKKKDGILGDPGDVREDPLRRWLRRWAKTLNEAENKPTLAELEVLVHACVKAGYCEDAIGIVKAILDSNGAWNSELDVFTRARLCVAGAEASIAEKQFDQGRELLSSMPKDEELVAAFNQAVKPAS
jgi:hypothetical protein